MRKLIISVMVCAFAGQVAFSRSGRIVAEGSTTVFPIAQAAAEVYMNMYPDVDITIRGGGSGVGVASIIEGTCDLGMASRPMKDREIKTAIEKGVDPVAHTIALDGIAVVVHPSNTITQLSIEQLRDIYTGKISNWSQLGAEEKKIVVISRDAASGTFEAFNKLVLAGGRVRADSLMTASNRAVSTNVSQTPGAIGYVGLGYLNPQIKPVKIEGIVPSKESVISGKYPLARPLFMYTNSKPAGETKKFLDFLLGPKGQELVDELGYVSVQ